MITAEISHTLGIVGVTTLVLSGITNTINQNISFVSLAIGTALIIMCMGGYIIVTFNNVQPSTIKNKL